jgi:N-acetylmuramic acid 6-phosphate etherase
MARLMNAEDAQVAPAIARELPQVAAAIDAIAERMRAGGRLIYVGAGTSGRMGVLDAAECPPTFGTAPGQVVALIAGGTQAITSAVEGAEDDQQAGARAINELNVIVQDSVVGIASSGSTPYVLGSLQQARARGALTISLAGNRPAPIQSLAEINIAPRVGPEALTGSTRLKAGTAQKMVLNMISTGVMIRLGKTFSNLMVDVQPTNAKLRARARRIVAQAGASAQRRLDEEEANVLLQHCDGEVKTAIVCLLAGVSPQEARARLKAAGGVVRRALDETFRVLKTLKVLKLLIGVDGGGSKTRALAADLQGRILGRGSAGPSNYHAVGGEAARAALDAAINAALTDAGASAAERPAALCLGLAGMGRPGDLPIIESWAKARYPGIPLVIVPDAQLALAAGTPAGWGLALVSGTGTLAFGADQAGRTSRSGGWGYVLGDEGSGYAIGLAALRAVARASDGRAPSTALTGAVLGRWSLASPQDLVGRVYQSATQRSDIAGLAALVHSVAQEGDAVAQALLRDAGRELALAAQAVARNLELTEAIPCALAGSVLVQGQAVAAALLECAADLGLRLEPVTLVQEAALGAVRLARKKWARGELGK